MHRESILILDFGSQYTQLIARRIREARVYSEIVPFNTSPEEIRKRNPAGIILSGGPSSVFEDDSPHPDPWVYDYPGPLLGICYGMQLMAHNYGGRVTPSQQREYGKAIVAQGSGGNGLFTRFAGKVSGLDESRRPDRRGPGRIRHPGPYGKPRGRHGQRPNRNATHCSSIRKSCTLPRAPKSCAIFSSSVCGCSGSWTVASFVEESVELVRQQIGDGSAVCGLSGGVDSSVAAMLVHQAIGDRLTCIFVDNGLLRHNEFEDVLHAYRALQLNVVGVDAHRSIPRGPCRSPGSRKEAPYHRRRVHPRLLRKKRPGWTTSTFSSRERSIPTSSNLFRSVDPLPSSSLTTMSAACPRS